MIRRRVNTAYHRALAGLDASDALEYHRWRAVVRFVVYHGIDAARAAEARGWWKCVRLQQRARRAA